MAVAALLAATACSPSLQKTADNDIEREFAETATRAGAVRSPDGVDETMRYVADAVRSRDGLVYNRTASADGQRGTLDAVFIRQADIGGGWTYRQGEVRVCARFRFRKISAVYVDVTVRSVTCSPDVQPSPTSGG